MREQRGHAECRTLARRCCLAASKLYMINNARAVLPVDVFSGSSVLFECRNVDSGPQKRGAHREPDQTESAIVAACGRANTPLLPGRQAGEPKTHIVLELPLFQLVQERVRRSRGQLRGRMCAGRRLSSSVAVLRPERVQHTRGSARIETQSDPSHEVARLTADIQCLRIPPLDGCAAHDRYATFRTKSDTST